MIKEQRIYGLDALRAVAMLLGVLLHSAIAYKVKPHRNWLHDPVFSYWIFDALYFLIHSFRMALFFLIAGYFFRLLYYKIGEKQFIIHRWKRVGVPFIFAMIFILPLSVVPYNAYLFIYRNGLPIGLALKKSFMQVFAYNGLAHLWFLYDLMIFYVCGILLLRCRKYKSINNMLNRFSQWWMNIHFKSVVWLMVAVIPIWVCLIPENGLFVLTDTSIIPKRINNLFFYGFMVFLGWLFNKRTEVFSHLSNRYYLFLWPGLILTCILFYIDWINNGVYSSIVALIMKFGAALQILLLVFGLIGLFLAVFKTESKTWKYISDASYWVYLIHLSIVISLQVLFLRSGIPGVLRFPLVLSIAVLLSFITYHLLVRFTFIGTMLHGSRKRVSD
ncbi:MAG: acyltransferase family protein [Agriterribacter sp.]